MRAYQFWQERGVPWGTPESDWFRAEHESMPDNSLADLARNVGRALGTVVAFVSDGPAGWATSIGPVSSIPEKAEGI